MKIIIAGGRDYQFTEDDTRWLDELLKDKQVTEVVSGGAKGADTCGEFWAAANGIPVKRFPPDWNKHGRAAGHVRNRAMADYLAADGGGLVILFPGGTGTKSMEQASKLLGLSMVKRTNGAAGVAASCGGQLWGQ